MGALKAGQLSVIRLNLGEETDWPTECQVERRRPLEKNEAKAPVQFWTGPPPERVRFYWGGSYCPDSHERRFGMESLTIPVWPAPVIAALPLALVVAGRARTGRRRRLGLCAACGYDRRGISAGAVCPECGSGGAAPASSSSSA